MDNFEDAKNLGSVGIGFIFLLFIYESYFELDTVMEFHNYLYIKFAGITVCGGEMFYNML